MTFSQGKCFRLPSQLRIDFAIPRGRVFSGTELIDFLQRECRSIVTVGDIVSRTVLENGLKPLLVIIDGHTRRSGTAGLDVGFLDEFIEIKIVNPPGVIAREAVEAICAALSRRHRTLVLVEGEEDMLALPSIACSPDDTCVVYGVPEIGAAVVKVRENERYTASSRLLSLEPTEC